MTTIALKEYMDGYWFVVKETGNGPTEDTYLHADGTWKTSCTAREGLNERTEGDGWFATREEGEAALALAGEDTYDVKEGMGWIFEGLQAAAAEYN